MTKYLGELATDPSAASGAAPFADCKVRKAPRASCVVERARAAPVRFLCVWRARWLSLHCAFVFLRCVDRPTDALVARARQNPPLIDFDTTKVRLSDLNTLYGFFYQHRDALLQARPGWRALTSARAR